MNTRWQMWRRVSAWSVFLAVVLIAEIWTTATSGEPESFPGSMIAVEDTAYFQEKSDSDQEKSDSDSKAPKKRPDDSGRVKPGKGRGNKDKADSTEPEPNAKTDRERVKPRDLRPVPPPDVAKVDISGEWEEKVRLPHRVGGLGSEQVIVRKPSRLQVALTEDGINVTRNGQTTSYQRVEGQIYRQPATGESLVMTGQFLLLQDGNGQVQARFIRRVELEPTHLVGLWISEQLSGQDFLDYFRFPMEDGGLRALRNDHESGLTEITDFSSEGFKIGQESYEFFGPSAFAVVVPGQNVERLYHRVEMQKVSVTLVNNTTDALNVVLIPVIRTLPKDNALPFVDQGNQAVLAPLASGTQRVEKVDEQTVILFSDATGEIYRERVVQREDREVKISVRRAPAETLSAIDGQWYGPRGGAQELTLHASTVQVLEQGIPGKPNALSLAAIPARNARSESKPKSEAKKERTPANTVVAAEPTVFKAVNRAEQMVPNVYRATDGRTLFIYSAEEARLLSADWVAMPLVRKLDLAGLTATAEPVDLVGRWSDGPTVVNVSAANGGAFEVAGETFAPTSIVNVLRSPGRTLVVSGRDTFHLVASEESHSDRVLSYDRLIIPDLDRRLVPLGLVDDPQVTPEGTWIQALPVSPIAPRNLPPPKTWNFATSQLGLHDGEQHLFRVDESQNIFRDSMYWYVFVDPDRMFRATADGQLTIFTRLNSTASMLSPLTGTGGFASTLATRDVDLTGKWRGTPFRAGATEVQWEISADTQNGAGHYRINAGEALQLNAAGVLTPQRWSGYGTRYAFTMSFDSFARGDRWELVNLTDRNYTAQRVQIENAVSRLPASWLVVNPNLIVENYATRNPAVFRRVGPTQPAEHGGSAALKRVEPCQVTLRWLQTDLDKSSPFGGSSEWSLTLKSSDNQTLGPITLLDRSANPDQDVWRKDCTTLVATAFGPRMADIVSVELRSTGAQVLLGQAVVQIQRPNRLEAIIVDDQNVSGWTRREARRTELAYLNLGESFAFLTSPNLTKQRLLPHTAWIPKDGRSDNIFNSFSTLEQGANDLNTIDVAFASPEKTGGIRLAAHQVSGAVPLLHGPLGRRLAQYDADGETYLISIDDSGHRATVQRRQDRAPLQLAAVETGGILNVPWQRPTVFFSKDRKKSLYLSASEGAWREYDANGSCTVVKVLSSSRSQTTDKPLTMAMLGSVNPDPEALLKAEVPLVMPYSEENKALMARVADRQELPLVWFDHYEPGGDSRSPQFNVEEVQFAYEQFENEFRKRPNNSEQLSFAGSLARNHYPYGNNDYYPAVDTILSRLATRDPARAALYDHLKTELAELCITHQKAYNYIKFQAEQNHYLATTTMAQVLRAHALLSVSGLTDEDAPEPPISDQLGNAMNGLSIALDVVSMAASFLPILGPGISKMAEKSEKLAKISNVLDTTSSSYRELSDQAKKLKRYADAMQKFQAGAQAFADGCSVVQDNVGLISGWAGGTTGEEVEETSEFTMPNTDQVNNRVAELYQNLLRQFDQNDLALIAVSRLATRDLCLLQELAAADDQMRAWGNSDFVEQITEDREIIRRLTLNVILQALLPLRLGGFSRGLEGNLQAAYGRPHHALRNRVRNHGWGGINTIAHVNTSEDWGWSSWSNYGDYAVLYGFDALLVPPNMNSDKAIAPLSPELVQLISESGITRNDLQKMVIDNKAWYISPAVRWTYWSSWGGWGPEFSDVKRASWYRRCDTIYGLEFGSDTDYEGWYKDTQGHWRSYRPYRDGHVWWTQESLENSPDKPVAGSDL